MADILLPANLPENWAWDQIVPPNGSDIGATEEYGYNYLMKQVNAAQKACMELAAENEALREELAKKADEGIPEEHLMELLPGFEDVSGNCLYSKDAFGWITVRFHFSITNTPDAWPYREPIAFIPQGFTPAVGHYDSCVYHNMSSQAAPGIVHISTTGEMQMHLYNAVTGTVRVIGSTRFPAAH